MVFNKDLICCWYCSFFVCVYFFVYLFIYLFSDAEWVGRGDIVMSASDTQAVFMVHVSSHGSATAKKAGVAFSATRVSSQSLPEYLF